MQSMPELAAEFEWTSDEFRLRRAPQQSFAVARTSRPEQPEALQGFHSEHLLFLIDEASGIPEGVFQTVQGALSTEGAFVLMAGNPTRMGGYFHDSHHKMRDKWAALHWNGEESPLVAREYVEDMRTKYGADSVIYRIRVRGEFAGNPEGVIPLALIESAVGRDVKATGAMVWGVDVARFGDDRSTLCKRAGRDLRLPVDDSLVAELSLPSYRVLSTGKIQVESKDELKKRGARSPDLGDALCLTFARGRGWGRMMRPPLVYPRRHDLP
jgi:hypothetical protein